MPRTCVILKCTSNAGQNGSNVPLFSVPAKDSLSRQKWMDFITFANAGFLWKETKQMYVCEDHFDFSAVKTNENKRRKLTLFQYPTLVYGKAICTENKKQDNDPRQLTIEELKTKLLERDEVISSLEEKLKLAKNEIRALQEKLKRRDLLIQKTEVTPSPDPSTLNPNDLQIITSELLKRLQKPGPYSDVIKEFAYQLHFYSPRAYNFLRVKFNNTLPHPRNFLRWTSHLETSPGILECSIAYIRTRNSNRETKVWYALSLDEVHIRRQIVYHDGIFKGYVNYGGITCQPEIQKEATAALFVMATEINGNLKLPICYILTNGLSSSLLADVIKACLESMAKAGAEVLSVTFDGLHANMKSVEIFGAKLNPRNDDFKSFFKSPITNTNIFVFLDPSHMMKLMRNVFKDFGVLRDKEDREINWKYIFRLHQLQVSEGLKAANKLSVRHVNFQNQKMKTKLCVQLFSNSISVALSVCRELGLDGFHGSEGTESFLSILDRLFDILNSRPYGKGFKSPITLSSQQISEPFLKMCFSYLLGLQVKIGKQYVPLHETRRGTPVIGLLVCISSLLTLVKEPGVMKAIWALPTHGISQDMLELFFSAVRSRFGFNNNPNCLQLQFALKGLLCMKMEGKLTSNCIELDDFESKISPLGKLSAVINNDNTEEQLFEDDADEDFVMEHNKLPTVSAFGLNIVFYISGYVCLKLCSTLNCAKCVVKLFPEASEIPSLERHSTMFLMRDKGGLFLPSLVIFDVCKLTEAVIRQHKDKGIQNLKRDEVVDFVLKQVLNESIFERLKCAPESSYDHCSGFLQNIVLFYIKIRFHHIAKESTLQMKPTTKRTAYNKYVTFAGE